MAGKRAFAITVSVHVKLAGETGIAGYSRMTLLVGEKYSDVNFADNAVKVLHEAHAGMQVKWAERERLKRLQTEMFAEI